jgi:hypothetical protein
VLSFVVEVGKARRHLPSSEFGTVSELSVASVVGVGALWCTTPQHSTSDDYHSCPYSVLSLENKALFERKKARFHSRSSRTEA